MIVIVVAVLMLLVVLFPREVAACVWKLVPSYHLSHSSVDPRPWRILPVVIDFSN